MATQKKSTLAIACGALLLLSSSATMAIEGNGLPIYPDGLESYMSGALPGPGVHLLMYGGAMRYNSLRRLLNPMACSLTVNKGNKAWKASCPPAIC